VVQAVGIGLVVLTQGLCPGLDDGVAGLGTAMVYPTLLARSRRGASRLARHAVGVYRLWRDGGYALGALLAGFGRPAGGAVASPRSRCSHLPLALWC